MDRYLTPKKRPNESPDTGCVTKRTPGSGVTSSQDDGSGSSGVYKLKILLPNGMAVLVKLPKGSGSVTVKDLAGEVKQQLARAIQARKTSTPKKSVKWDAELSFVDDHDFVIRNSVNLTKLELNKVYNLRLNDGSKPAEMYENMWDLTPDTELLMELPEEYTFETALADLIDNSLQAIWPNEGSDKKSIRVKVTDDKISIIDTGPGMDSTSIEKWGKMGASLHREYKTQAIGGKPPYLKPAFGMFGYGGFIASMHLGRYTELSSKTKNSKKVYMLRLERDALISGSGSKRTWTTYGGLRDPTDSELKLSSGGSFTKVDIFEPKMRGIDVRRLKCKLKDIYFPYIQCDDLSKKGLTMMPVDFWVNGNNLAEIRGGEVAVTNLHSCNGPEFVLQLRFYPTHNNVTTSSPGSRLPKEANARLRCVYLPVKDGKESIEIILETLKQLGYDYREDFGSFSHVSCRRLGRLLPDARWAWLPFMDLRQKKEDRSQILKRSCMRVKCFIETDAGFNPTPSKTDFAHQNSYTTALKNLGSKQPLEKETGVEIEIRKEGKSLNLSQLDKQYQQWLMDMHDRYDEEVDCGVDEPVILENPLNKKELHISTNGEIVRVHKALRRKGKSWKTGQKIKILKGACAGFHKNNVYATLEYILLEGFQGDAGGNAWIICRTIDIPKEDGCLLEIVDGNPKFNLRKSLPIPINAVDSGKCLAVDDSEWNNQIKKQYQKRPSSIEMVNSRQCCKLGIDASLPDEREVYAGDYSHCEIVAVVRPATYKSGTDSKHLYQKYVMKDNFEMSLAITFYPYKSSRDETIIYSGRISPSSRNDFDGLYVFKPKYKSYPLFHKSGLYTLTFSINDSSCEKCVEKVRVKPLREIHKWALTKKISDLEIRVGCLYKPISISMFDIFDNQIPFSKVPKLLIKVKYTGSTIVQVNQWNSFISLDKLALILEDLLIEMSNLDSILPTYNATLMLCLPDGSNLLDIPIKVLPGPVKCFTVQPENFVKQLIPGQVINELTVELFDAYGNHVQENEKMELIVDGCGWLDRSSSGKQVDAFGCIELGGLMRVTAGYGQNVSLSIRSKGKLISKEWQIEKRQLRTASVIPETCFAGSQLENLEFEVIDSKGDVDVNFHDEDKIGQSHTLVIKSQFEDIDESVKYVFRKGRCIVRSVPVPSEIGEFSVVVAHSRCSELQLTVKVLVEQPPEMEPLNISHQSTNENIISHTQFDYTSVQHYTPEKNASSLLDLYSTPEAFLNFQKDLENEILEYGLSIAHHEKNIKECEIQITAIESELSQLEGIQHKTLCIAKYGSPGKNEIISRVESKVDNAASLVMTLFRGLSETDRRGSMGNIIGVVALLGTAPTLNLSRIFAEYLGDQMLAVVCKSYEDVNLLETYDENGKLNASHALHMFASELGQPISGRYLILCIEDIRACELDKDLQGKLMLPNPTLPDGSTPAGFLGYAVNMIDIDVDHIDTKTDSGCGLRETLFYRLFGETQVYKSREEMKRAISCIKDGAVSLDGGIFRGNGAVSLGCLNPDVIFPVAAPRTQEGSPNDKKLMRHYKELKLHHKDTVNNLTEEWKRHESVMKEFNKTRDLYTKYFTRNPLDIGHPQVSKVDCLEEKPVNITQCLTPTYEVHSIDSD
uniref:structural maintenance of chromosomes flexible hinge domain-containing protein GMI1 n=1 Tax=Erigeron canadensis TaxID=72917 RepID=UPI001CB99099|nr:structural maintenance of chromosomes flexible hinge domain-containing protein GMI1 [Erigeron canadensis]